jgi:2-iminoacetate synthase ThiH
LEIEKWHCQRLKEKSLELLPGFNVEQNLRNLHGRAGKSGMARRYIALDVIHMIGITNTLSLQTYTRMFLSGWKTTVMIKRKSKP